MPKIARISNVSEFGPGKDRDLKLLECASLIMSNISTRNRVILRDWVIGVSYGKSDNNGHETIREE